MSEMEDDARELLYRTLMTVSVGALWLLINSTFGLMFEWFFFTGKPTLGNYIFYIWFLASDFFLVRYFSKLWKHRIKVN